MFRLNKSRGLKKIPIPYMWSYTSEYLDGEITNVAGLWMDHFALPFVVVHVCGALVCIKNPSCLSLGLTMI